jgi:uncharacterized repeat protein (TIGR01451 family)
VCAQRHATRTDKSPYSRERKTASPASGVTSGTVITFTMTATNTGSTTITDARITDPMPGLSALDCTPAQGSDLAAGATITCAGTYTATAADVAAGQIANTATVRGTGVQGAEVLSASTAVASTAASPTTSKAAGKPNELSLTGADVLRYALFGLLLVLSGRFVLVLGRRRATGR